MYILDDELVQVTEEGFEKILIQIKVMMVKRLLNALLSLSTRSKKRLVLQKSAFGFVLSIHGSHRTQIQRICVLYLQLQASQQTV